MGTTYSTLLSQVRTRLGETSALEWTDATLINYISRAEVWLARMLAKIRNSGRFQYQEQETLASGSSVILWSAMTKRFDVVRKIEMLLPGGWWSDPLTEIYEMQENQWTGPTTATYGGLVVPGYIVREPDFIFLPIANEARTLRFTYNWLPATGKTSVSTADTPVDYDDMLELRAIHFALADVGETNKSFEDEYSSRIAEIEEIECMRSHGGGGERVVMTGTRLW